LSSICAQNFQNYSIDQKGGRKTKLASNQLLEIAESLEISISLVILRLVLGDKNQISLSEFQPVG